MENSGQFNGIFEGLFPFCVFRILNEKIEEIGFKGRRSRVRWDYYYWDGQPVVVRA